MLAKSEYLEKLKDPRWQKKRLEILERDTWTCQVCGDTKSTLHVHHSWYECGVEPWDYPDGCFTALCETCHEQEPKGLNLNWLQQRLSGIGKVALDVSILSELADLYGNEASFDSLRKKISLNLRSFGTKCEQRT